MEEIYYQILPHHLDTFVQSFQAFDYISQLNVNNRKILAIKLPRISNEALIDLKKGSFSKFWDLRNSADQIANDKGIIQIEVILFCTQNHTGHSSTHPVFHKCFYDEKASWFGAPAGL